MDGTLLTVLLAVIASSGIWSVVLAIVQYRLKQRDKDTDVKKMLLALAHDRIYRLCEDFISEQQSGERDGVTREEWENLDILYQGYKQLGGNGTCEKLYTQVAQMLII